MEVLFISETAKLKIEGLRESNDCLEKEELCDAMTFAIGALADAQTVEREREVKEVLYALYRYSELISELSKRD